MVAALVLVDHPAAAVALVQRHRVSPPLQRHEQRHQPLVRSGSGRTRKGSVQCAAASRAKASAFGRAAAVPQANATVVGRAAAALQAKAAAVGRPAVVPQGKAVAQSLAERRQYREGRRLRHLVVVGAVELVGRVRLDELVDLQRKAKYEVIRAIMLEDSLYLLRGL